MYVAATFRGGNVAVVGSTGDAGGCEVRVEHTQTGFTRAQWRAARADERNEVGSRVVDFVLGGRHQGLSGRQMDTSGIGDRANNRPRAVRTVTNVGQRGTARRNA